MLMHLLFVLSKQDLIWWTLSRLEPWIQGSRLRKAALEEVMRLVHYEVRTWNLILASSGQLRSGPRDTAA